MIKDSLITYTQDLTNLNELNSDDIEKSKTNSRKQKKQESNTNITRFEIKRNEKCVYIDVDIHKDFEQNDLNEYKELVKNKLLELFPNTYIESSCFHGFHIVLFVSDWVSREYLRNVLYRKNNLMVELYTANKDLKSRALTIDNFKVVFNGVEYRSQSLTIPFETYINKELKDVLVLSKTELDSKLNELIDFFNS